MSVKVWFSTNNSDNRHMLKDLTPLNQTAIVCDIYEPTDIINPVLIVDKDQISLTNTNYCQIEEFGRYYFINDIQGMPGNKVAITCHVDVLMTYNNQIRNCPIIAARSTNITNSYLVDNHRIFKSYPENIYIEIGQLNEPDSLILITV